MDTMNIGDIFKVVLGLGAVFFIFLLIYFTFMNSRNKRREKCEGLKGEIEKNRCQFVNVFAAYFKSRSCKYESTYAQLLKYIDKMVELNNCLTAVSEGADESDKISYLCETASAFKTWAQKMNDFSAVKMLDITNYGAVNQSFWNSVRALNLNVVNQMIDEYDRCLETVDFSGILKIDIEMVLKCVWFYATNKPYSASDFKKSVDIFYRIHKKSNIEVFIAEAFAIKQMGGDDVLREKIRSELSHGMPEYTQYYGKGIYLPGKNHTAPSDAVDVFTTLASGFMWMRAYQEEEMVLQYMLRSGMQMTAKMQERLHSLSNGGGGAPVGFDIEANHNIMYFDISALAWKDDEYTGLFENLVFQEKKLSYALAVRDEDKDLFISQQIEIPDIEHIFNTLKSVFREEYGTSVHVDLINCVALSGSGEERMKGILVTADECRQMGILVHVARIGKKMDIKFYTLFMPVGNKAEDQKQKALSLYKKLSPVVTMWEKSLKDTILMAIQQLLNTGSQYEGREDRGPHNHDDIPVF